MEFRHNGRLFRIGNPWRDGDTRPWRSLYIWGRTDEWKFVISASHVAGRNYYDGDTIDYLKRYAREHF